MEKTAIRNDPQGLQGNDAAEQELIRVSVVVEW